MAQHPVGAAYDGSRLSITYSDNTVEVYEINVYGLLINGQLPATCGSGTVDAINWIGTYEEDGYILEFSYFPAGSND